MTLKQIVELLDANVLCGKNRLDEEYSTVFAADLMSDILTLGDKLPIILTGLCTVQTIRTCEMANIDVIIFVRRKKPSAEIVELAIENDMILIECSYSMFKACGILFQNGMNPLF